MLHMHVSHHSFCFWAARNLLKRTWIDSWSTLLLPTQDLLLLVLCDLWFWVMHAPTNHCSPLTLAFRIWLPAAWHADLKWHQQPFIACIYAECSQSISIFFGPSKNCARRTKGIQWIISYYIIGHLPSEDKNSSHGRKQVPLADLLWEKNTVKCLTDSTGKL